MFSDKIKAYIFDLDDTLYDESQYVSAAFLNVGKYLEENYNIDAVKVLDFCLASIEESGRGRTFDYLCDEFGIKESVSKLVEVYRSTAPKLDLCEDSRELLSQLKKKGIKTGVITDGIAMVQDNKVRGLHLYDEIDEVILTDALTIDGETHFSKPDPAVYKACLERLGVEPNEAVYIGDNPLKDFIGARSLGMKTVRINRGKGLYKDAEIKPGYDADITVHSLKELI